MHSPPFNKFSRFLHLPSSIDLRFFKSAHSLVSRPHSFGLLLCGKKKKELKDCKKWRLVHPETKASAPKRNELDERRTTLKSILLVLDHEHLQTSSKRHLNSTKLSLPSRFAFLDREVTAVGEGFPHNIEHLHGVSSTR